MVLGLAVGVRAAGPLVLAEGRGVQVTQEHLDEAFINLRASLAAQGRTIPESQRARTEQQLVEKIALTQLLLSRATEADRKQAQEKVAKILKDQRERAESPERFDAQVRAAGLDPATFEAQLLERAICEEVLARDLASEIAVTPEQVRSYYDQNPEEFRQPERIRLQQIVLATRHPTGAELSEAEKAEKRQLATRLLERLRSGADISALAREYSDDPAGRDRGGEYVFPVGRIVPELESVLLAMPTNKVSDIITTPFGLHIAKVIERLPGQLVPFEEVRERIKTRLEVAATQEFLPSYQKRLFEEAGVKFHPIP